MSTDKELRLVILFSEKAGKGQQFLDLDVIEEYGEVGMPNLVES